MNESKRIKRVSLDLIFNQLIRLSTASTYSKVRKCLKSKRQKCKAYRGRSSSITSLSNSSQSSTKEKGWNTCSLTTTISGLVRISASRRNSTNSSKKHVNTISMATGWTLLQTLAWRHRISRMTGHWTGWHLISIRTRAWLPKTGLVRATSIRKKKRPLFYSIKMKRI